MKMIEVKDIIIGNRYLISGDLQNGYMDGKPYICHEEVTRAITRITDTHVICECGRQFLKNQNLKIVEY
ncbi:hypothetical protein HMPREF1212_05072 [Parabacteroides sp. HGS0025]|uniref:hypothetical protein n=1 Tax=Parabacteroides sp. HGS0025 TaxID=1078087 RepID=UPI000616EA49|nr:hypothetical protein [Parabacteroides sp. HGS0025]KKB45415.1 hypothetical protein HMPREF1212_05088 [Parabacteroides sp. HGS0025]KKB45916.1 hypothetical protein HMPREF1212_05072 [Parabacteroides sp. HGS0025]